MIYCDQPPPIDPPSVIMCEVRDLRFDSHYLFRDGVAPYKIGDRLEFVAVFDEAGKMGIVNVASAPWRTESDYDERRAR
jgi:hypothetical protein